MVDIIELDPVLLLSADITLLDIFSVCFSLSIVSVNFDDDSFGLVNPRSPEVFSFW